jgi:hypothetical protein
VSRPVRSSLLQRTLSAVTAGLVLLTAGSLPAHAEFLLPAVTQVLDANHDVDHGDRSGLRPVGYEGSDHRTETATAWRDDYRGWSVAFDNDLFAFAEHDQDYTGGFAVSTSGSHTRTWLGFGSALGSIDNLLFRRGEDVASTSVFHSAQVGLLSFTPRDIVSRNIVEDDRPYASLLYTTSVRQYVSADERSVRQTGLTVGVLGLSLTSDLHGAIHDAVGSETPKGYRHQISAGGEPTARYFMSNSKLRLQRIALGSGLLELKTTSEISVGYLTETSYAVSARMGSIGTPWWTFNPERVDYVAQPSASPGANASGEFYFWAGAKVRLRAYNSFLQGQFRDSDHVLGSNEVRHVIGEAWLGLTGQLSSGTQMSYVIRYQTAEVRDGLASRDPVWAGVTITHSF